MPRRTKRTRSPERTGAKKRRVEAPPPEDRLATLAEAEAEADMLAGGLGHEVEEPVEEPEALHEAESELGISEWIDPDTGGPAEDNVPRLEDH